MRRNAQETLGSSKVLLLGFASCFSVYTCLCILNWAKKITTLTRTIMLLGQLKFYKSSIFNVMLAFDIKAKHLLLDYSFALHDSDSTSYS